MTIKAIETSYKGYRFRSRLEARWAVFFDVLGVKWEYEKEGFPLPSGNYLPDFWVPLSGHYARQYSAGNPPVSGFWVEIKPVDLTESEKVLCRELAVYTGHKVYAAAGEVAEGFHYSWHPKGFTNRELMSLPQDADCHTGFMFYLVAEAVVDEPYCFERIEEAIRAARSARFEHGESGARERTGSHKEPEPTMPYIKPDLMAIARRFLPPNRASECGGG